MFPPNLPSTASVLSGKRDSQKIHSANWASKSRMQHVGTSVAASCESQVPRIPPKKPFVHNLVHRPIRKSTYGFVIPEPQPRTFEELHTERVYLLACLQQENEKATQLLKRILPLEEILVLAQVSHERKEAKKTLGWLRYRIKETTLQEKAILARLGQLSYEIQSRERWTQVESERQQQSQYAKDGLSQGMQNLQLNTRWTEFQPRKYDSMPHATSVPQQYHRCEANTSQPSIQSYASEPPAHNNSSLDGLSEGENSEQRIMAKEDETVQRPPTSRRSSSMNRAEPPILVTDPLCVSIPGSKRHSL
jgi:hypothetical protein